MLKSLRKALATYAQGDKGTLADPLFDEEQVLAEYASSIGKVQAHLSTVGFDLNVLINAEEGGRVLGGTTESSKRSQHFDREQENFSGAG